MGDIKQQYRQLLDTKAVSQWTGVPEETLRYWRHTGIGPVSFKLGPRRVVYASDDVAAWIDGQRQLSARGGA